MLPSILVAGLDGRSLPLEAPLLRREGHTIQELASAREVFEALASAGGGRLVVLGPRLPDLDLHEAVQRIRASALTRHVSILVILGNAEPEDTGPRALEAGANAVLRRPLDEAALEAWLGKLLAVPRRVEARVPVQGQVVGTPKAEATGHFYGLTRNLSINGMLLASPVRLEPSRDVELEFGLPDMRAGLRALGRVVREAGDVAWPYIGYGVEFLFVPQDSIESIASFIHRAVAVSLSLDAPRGIHSTVRREFWIYEILEPVAGPDGWQAEIRRAPREAWRPGAGGPFYVVLGDSPADALSQARGFIQRHG
jgi:CheY-like chemotaxis protein